MGDKQDVYSSHQVLEFITVAAEYCAMMENNASFSKEDFLRKMQKLLPLLYLKATLLPHIEDELGEYVQTYVTEKDWDALFFAMKAKLGEDVEYLEVFDDRISDSETPIVASLAENFADIYQDLRDFLTNYHLGTPELSSEALSKLNEYFNNHWGQYTVNAIRAIHHIITKKYDNDF